MNRRNFMLSTSAALASAVAWGKSNTPSAQAAPVAASGSEGSGPPLLFGTDYYPDQTPERLWEQDAVQMAAAGITNVRMAEFAWALMEPAEGQYEFDWLLRSLAILHNHGIAVILGTPSAAPPPWLSAKYPEILMVDEHGMTLSPGARRFTCPSSPAYRELSVAVATRMAKAAAGAPGVIGWQIDNELTLGSSARCYCRSCRTGFQQWLRDRYGSLASLNEKWGTVFWSNTYTDFSQIPVPLPSGAPPNPGLALDYDRYQSAANVEFLELQLAVLRKLCPGQFMTTNNVGLADNIVFRDLYRNLDFAANDNYPGFFAIHQNRNKNGAGAASDAVTTTVSFGHDLMRGFKDGKPFMVMEEQTGKAGQPIFCPQPEPGQLRLWSYQAIAHGAMGINYFRWDTTTFGAEEYWHGMLRHDRSHSPGFDEICATMKELKALGSTALNAPYRAKIALCYDSDSDWAFVIQAGQPDIKYLNELLPWYGSLAASQAGVDIVNADQDLTSYKVVCAPAMYIVKPRQAERIRTFVNQGGTFIAGFRLGVKDQYSRIVNTPLPGLLRDVMGCELDDYEPIYEQDRGVKFSGALSGPDAQCSVWADILTPASASTLATYTNGQYAGKAAITSNSFGGGKAVYVGCHLEPADLGRVLLTLLGAAGLQPLHGLPAGVECTTRESGQQSWTYLLNHTGHTQTARLNGNFREFPGGAPVSGTIDLPPYGVKVLTSA